jgi:hypothetical protein
MNQPTPLGVDMYSRFMALHFDERDIIGVSTAFQSLFATGGQTIFSTSNLAVDIDIVRGNRKTAKMVIRGNRGKILNKKDIADGKSTNIVRKYPLMQEDGFIDADELNFRQAGENSYNRKGKIERLRMLAVRRYQEMVRRIVRANERLSAQSVLEGKQDAIFGTTNTDLQYDFLRNANNIIAVADEWNDGGVIMDQINAGCNAVRQNGKVNPNAILIGQDALPIMVNDSTMSALADNRRYDDLVRYNDTLSLPPDIQSLVNAGFLLYGKMRTTQGYSLWILTYMDEYETDAGVVTPYMPLDQAVIFATNARRDRYFGPGQVLPPDNVRNQWYMDYFGFNVTAPPMPQNIKNMNAVINPAMFYSDAYPTSDFTGINLRIQAAPIFSTTQTDAFCTLTGLVKP